MIEYTSTEGSVYDCSKTEPLNERIREETVMILRDYETF